MAKQENKSRAGEPTQVSHPDPTKDALVLRYPLDGSVKVVSALSMDNNTLHMTTVEPLTKNHAAFMQLTDSRFVARFFSTMRIQAYTAGNDVKTVPELYRVPYHKVGIVGEALARLQLDARDEEALKIARPYRTSTNTLSKVMYDRSRMPLHELAAAGFDVAQMQKDGLIASMELGRQTRLIPLNHKLGEHLAVEGLYSIHPYYDDEGTMHFKVQSPLPVPEFLTDERVRMVLNSEDTALLRLGRTLDRFLIHNDEPCYAALNRETNRMIYVPRKDVQVPDYLYNVRLTAEQKGELRQGGRTKLEECHYQNSDNLFSGHAQFDVQRMDFIVADPHYERIYIPEQLDKQLDTRDRIALHDFKQVDGRKYTKQDHQPYNCMLQINKETNGLEFVNYQRAREMREAAAQEAEKATVQEAVQTQAPGIPEMDDSPAPEMPPLLPEQPSEGRRQGPRM